MKTGKVKFFNDLGNLVEFDFSFTLEEFTNFILSMGDSIQSFIF
jgi:hypothetical protein